MSHTPIELAVKTSVYEVIKHAHAEWGYDRIVKDIIEFCEDQPDLRFENKLSEALQKFKEENA